jgi:GAF domain-containing protein
MTSDLIAAFLAVRLAELERRERDLAKMFCVDITHVLRDFEAKRAILAEREEVHAKYAEYSASTDRELSGWWAGRVIEIDRVIRILAAAWNGHPDYRQEWAPRPTSGAASAGSP